MPEFEEQEPEKNFYCRMHDHTSTDIEQPQIPSDIDLTPEQGNQTSDGTSLTLFHHKLWRGQERNPSQTEKRCKWKLR